MKKAKTVLSIIIIVAMIMSLVACGGNDAKTEAPVTEVPTMEAPTTEAPTTEEPTTEEPTTEAPTVPSKEDLLKDLGDKPVSVNDIANAASQNKAKAQATYCGKVLWIRGYVYVIETDHVVITDGGNWAFQIKAFLPLEELVELENSQMVDVVGQFSDEIGSDSVDTGGYGQYPIDVMTMNIAYFVKDHYPITGKLFGGNRSYAPAYNFAVPPTSKVYSLLYFADDVNPSDYGINGLSTNELTVMTKIIRKGLSNFEYRDATPEKP